MNLETPTNNFPALAATQALVAREVQEVQGAIISAKRFPRDQRAAFDRVMQACARPSLAEEAEYAYPRGGETVSGPTIRLVEVCLQNWGNCQAGVKILSSEEGSSEVEAFCWDIETNFRDSISFRVPHIRDTKKGPVLLTSERDIYEVVMNMGSRRKRKCIQNVIPGDLIEAARQECAKTLGSMAEKKDKVIAMIKSFQDDFRVSRDDIERRIGKRIEAITTPEFIQLKKIFVSLRDKMSKVEDWFVQVHEPEKTNQMREEAANVAPPVANPIETAKVKTEQDADWQNADKQLSDEWKNCLKAGIKPLDILGLKAAFDKTQCTAEVLWTYADRLNEARAKNS